MNRPIVWATVVAVTLGLIPVFHWNWQQQEPVAPADVPEEIVASVPQEITPSESPPPVQYAVPKETPTPATPAVPPLPSVDESDPVVLKSLVQLIKSTKVLRLFNMKNIVKRFVNTVDNLTGPAIPARFNVAKPVPGQFLTHQGGKDRWLINPENYRRYEIYVELFSALDVETVASIYVHFYPLCQQVYEELGYPNRYFNDRVIEVLDHLLATPEVVVPLVLIRPKVTYQYEDKRFENLSAGQKILLRMGPDNRARMLTVLKKWRDRSAALTAATS